MTASYFTPPSKDEIEAFIAAQTDRPEAARWSYRAAEAKLMRDRVKTAIERCQSLINADPSVHNLGMAMKTILDISVHAFNTDGD